MPTASTESVETLLARLEERLRSMEKAITAIDEKITAQLQGQDETIKGLAKRITDLEGWKNKVTGGLVVGSALLTLIQAYLVIHFH